MSETNVRKLMNAASVLTLLGLTCSMAAAFALIQGELELSLVFMSVCLVFDRFDGIVARKYNLATQFGADLDNLCDVISFGAVPALFIYRASDAWWVVFPAVLLVLTAVTRIARFSNVGLLVRNGKNYFVGLPITYPFIILFLTWPLLRCLESLLKAVILAVFAVIVSVLMVTRIAIRKGGAWEDYMLYLVYPLMLIYYVVVLAGIRLW